MTSMIDRLLEHDRFTTSMLLDMCHGLSDDQLDVPFDVGHATLRSGLGHMIHVVRLWKLLMEGKPVPQAPEKQSLSAMRKDHKRDFAAYATLARRLHDEHRLDETFVDHHGHAQTFGGTILQVAMHNQQHRIEAFHIMKRLGITHDHDGGPQEWEHMTGRIPAN
ncbi:MAG: DinB family protein [Thermomicrobiales bacterium]